MNITPSLFNSLWSRDATWHRRSWSILVQVTACCLTAISHYLNQYWLTINRVLCHSFHGDASLITKDIVHQAEFQICAFEITGASPRHQWVKHQAFTSIKANLYIKLYSKTKRTNCKAVSIKKLLISQKEMYLYESLQSVNESFQSGSVNNPYLKTIKQIMRYRLTNNDTQIWWYWAENILFWQHYLLKTSYHSINIEIGSHEH